MLRYLLFILLYLPACAQAQCLSGNCTSGKGKYDFGWCTYDGDFKNSKPDGTGTMKYSDYTYTGTFKDGVEDGNGTIAYTNGRTEQVRYVKGEKVQGPIKFAAADYKPLEGSDANCITGNCVTGTGTYQFPSGNKYSGQFVNRQREGQGTAYFANGDKFIGTWHNNEKQEGTYTYATGPAYTGTYDANGMELNGKIVAGTMVVPYINGVAHIPPPPKITYTTTADDRRTASAEAPIKPCCPICHCTGEVHETYYGGATAYDSYGNRSTVFGGYSKCTYCNGTGHTH